MKALRYAKRMIELESESRRSNRHMSRYLEMKLTKHGFVVEKVQYRDRRNIRKINLVAKKGTGTGGLAYFGHSDTVPAENWFSKKVGPFEPVVHQERLYGRGSCDMKGSIAAMLTAAQRFSWDEFKAPLYFVITADEEIGFYGARHVVNSSEHYREMVEGQTKAIIGEPTSLDVVHSHKGSVKIIAKARGEAAHSSSKSGKNANLAMIPFLNEMKWIHDETEADAVWQNSLFSPPTVSWNIVIKDNSPALNIKPSKSTCVVYFRTMPDVNTTPLLQRTQRCANKHGIELSLIKFSDPFYADPESEFVVESLKLANRPQAKTVSYGTDGGVLNELQDKIVFGPGSIDQAHTHDEWISLEQLKLGAEMYEKMIRKWCC